MFFFFILDKKKTGETVHDFKDLASSAGNFIKACIDLHLFSHHPNLQPNVEFYGTDGKVHACLA